MPGRWIELQRTRVDFGDALHDTWLVLQRSIDAVGREGSVPKYEVRLRLLPSGATITGLGGDSGSAAAFRLQDLTGDGIPEVVTGCRVWRIDAPGLFAEISPPSCLRWLDTGAGALGIDTRQSAGDSTCDRMTGEACHYEHIVYRWDNAARKFAVLDRMEAPRATEHESPFERDLPDLAERFGLWKGLAGASALTGPGPPPRSNPVNRLCRDHRWILLRQVRVNLGGALADATVQLLRSCEITGWTGLLEAHYDVDLVVRANDRVVYRFWEPHVFDDFTHMRPPRYFMGDALALRDVTGDGVPEVLFDSGIQGASSAGWYKHVLHADSGGRLRDVSLPDFEQVWTHPFLWANLGDKTLGLKGVQIEPENPTPEETCHSCAFRYEFRAYAWQPRANRFERIGERRTQKKYPGHHDPLGQELAAFLAQLESAAGITASSAIDPRSSPSLLESSPCSRSSTGCATLSRGRWRGASRGCRC